MIRIHPAMLSRRWQHATPMPLGKSVALDASAHDRLPPVMLRTCRGRQRPCSLTSGISQGYVPAAATAEDAAADPFIHAAAANLLNTLQPQEAATTS